MSTIETILTRMMQDPAFAEAIFSDMENALSEYSLSTEETSQFKELSRAQFDALGTNPEARQSFAVAHSGGMGAGKVSMHDISRTG